MLTSAGKYFTLRKVTDLDLEDIRQLSLHIIHGYPKAFPLLQSGLPLSYQMFQIYNHILDFLICSTDLL